MTRAHMPFVASTLLRFVASESPALAGDLAEEYGSGRPAPWFWRQLVQAVLITAWRKRRASPTVVRLVTETPYDRPDRSIALLDPATINLSGTKVRSIGGLGLLATIMLITVVMPQAWFLVVTGFTGGIIVGIVLVRRRRSRGLSGPADRRPIGLFEEPPLDSTQVAEGPSGGPMEKFATV